MQNLYEEIINILTSHNRSINDIKYIIMPDTSKDRWNDNIYEVDIDNFMEIAKRTNYDDGYGRTEIPKNLKIVGDYWWLERNEYDGSEWFEYKTLPIRPATKINIERIKW